ncbi:hypothetical protein [Grimontia sp. NTOU-MAR1]|uniref:hypothetical protein n=1 Tax=Grimontia sp. NTOU-MAR1 TaxID=3111011 RepID=UPI002DBB11DE|nr:hypothetical protein [Grimontia sp. NTOU-MAR1]WRV99298.1 hypothetical protein VP504_07850 [Grimontia sp. NTOU-MAR1]
MASLIVGCSDEQRLNTKFGNAGTLGGTYSIRDVLITDTSGAFSNFGYGSVSGYPGASSGLSGLGIPAHVSAYWSKPSETSPHPAAYYHLDSAIDTKLASQKIKTLKDAYTALKDKPGTLQVVVDKDQMQVLYTFKCFEVYDDCSKKDGSDPNGWIQPSPDGNTDVVLLYSGKGNTSPTAFPASPYDQRLIRTKRVTSTNITELKLKNEDGERRDLGDSMALPSSFDVSWATKTNPDADYSQWTFDRYQLSGKLNSPTDTENAIQAYRKATDGYLKTSTFDVFANNDRLFITYSAACLTEKIGEKCNVAEDPKNRWRYFDELGRHAVVLFEGKGDQVPSEQG